MITNATLPHRDAGTPHTLHDAIDRLLHSPASLSPHPTWLRALHEFGNALGAPPRALDLFVDAWRRLYTATLLLDHVQDGDKLPDPWFAALAPSLQYHVAFSVYLSAQSVLAGIGPELVAASRVAGLHSLWAASVTQLAEGQYHDLTESILDPGLRGSTALDRYEEIAGQKTGASFALGLGGVARLAGDEEAPIVAATQAGLILGMLLQYRDDLLDAPGQEVSPATLTLERALRATGSDGGGGSSPAAIWAFVYERYAEALAQSLLPLPPAARQIVQRLAVSMFTSGSEET